MQLSNLARKDGYDDRLYQPDVAASFLDAAHLESYVQQLNSGSSDAGNSDIDNSDTVNSDTVNKWGSTTHVSAIDGNGNAASVTTTNGEGSSYIIPGTGIMTNNMLGEADLHPNGFHQWQENVRISSMMAPTIILRDRQPEVVLGSGGSNRIRTAILQVVSNLIDFGMTVEDAVNSSRIHWEAGMFNVEPGLGNLQSDRLTFPFDGQVEFWAHQNMFFGGVHAVTCSAAGELDGAGDRRRGGAFGVV